jgi:hypothetical protein
MYELMKNIQHVIDEDESDDVELSLSTSFNKKTVSISKY